MLEPLTKIYVALGSGVPVVCSDLPGNSSLIEHEFNGVLAKAGSPKSYSKSILNVLQNLDFFRKVGLEGKETIIKDHNPSKVAEDLEFFYKKIIANAK